MTITLTVEELKAHEKALNEWASTRTNFSARWLHSNSDGSSMSFPSRQDFTRYEAALKDYDAKNPMPRLLPSV
jgi:hypothetical protein